MTKHAFQLVIALTCLIPTVSRSQSQPVVQPVALTGQPAPGMDGAVFRSVGRPALNNNGDVAFRSTLMGRDLLRNGVFLASGGSISKIAGYGELAPRSVATFSNFGDPAINDTRQIAFMGIIGTGINNQGLFFRSGTGLTAVAMTGDPAPGTAGNFAGFGQFGLLLSNAGKITFQATFKTTRPENGLFDYADGKITALVLEGRTAPGTGAGVFAQFRALARNDSGQLVFVAALRGGSARNGVFILDTTGLKTVVLDSQTAPYGTQGETFGTFSEPSIGADGTIAFVDNTGIQSRSVELVRKGIFQGNASSVSLRAAKGGEGVQRLHGNFQTPFALRYPDGTQATIFVAWNELRGKNALLVSRQNTLTRVLQEGDQSVAGGTYSFIGNLIVTSSGRFAFVSNLRDSPSKAGIFVGKII